MTVLLNVFNSVWTHAVTIPVVSYVVKTCARYHTWSKHVSDISNW